VLSDRAGFFAFAQNDSERKSEGRRQACAERQGEIHRFAQNDSERKSEDRSQKTVSFRWAGASMRTE